MQEIWVVYKLGQTWILHHFCHFRLIWHSAVASHHHLLCHFEHLRIVHHFFDHWVVHHLLHVAHVWHSAHARHLLVLLLHLWSGVPTILIATVSLWAEAKIFNLSHSWFLVDFRITGLCLLCGSWCCRRHLSLGLWLLWSGKIWIGEWSSSAFSHSLLSHIVEARVWLKHAACLLNHFWVHHRHHVVKFCVGERPAKLLFVRSLNSGWIHFHHVNHIVDLRIVHTAQSICHRFAINLHTWRTCRRGSWEGSLRIWLALHRRSLLVRSLRRYWLTLGLFLFDLHTW